jgi:hypothetical protein
MPDISYTKEKPYTKEISKEFGLDKITVNFESIIDKVNAVKKMVIDLGPLNETIEKPKPKK